MAAKHLLLFLRDINQFTICSSALIELPSEISAWDSAQWNSTGSTPIEGFYQCDNYSGTGIVIQVSHNAEDLVEAKRRAFKLRIEKRFTVKQLLEYFTNRFYNPSVRPRYPGAVVTNDEASDAGPSSFRQLHHSSERVVDDLPDPSDFDVEAFLATEDGTPAPPPSSSSRPAPSTRRQSATDAGAASAHCAANANVMNCSCAEVKPRLDTLINQQRVILTAVEQLVACMRQGQDKEQCNLPQGINLPCQTIRDLQELDRRLTNRDDRMLITNNLQQYSQSAVKDSIRAFCRRIFSKNLANQLNLTGTDRRHGLAKEFPHVLKALRGKLYTSYMAFWVKVS